MTQFEAEEWAARALVMAQRIADQVIEEAKVTARSIVEAAEVRARAIVAEAQNAALPLAQASHGSDRPGLRGWRRWR